MPETFGELSDIIDTHANDFQHYKFMTAFEWMYEVIQERDDGYTQDAIE